MQKILFINHNAEKCGVADYGRRLYAILKDHMDIDYCDTEPGYTGYDIALYNYHYATMPNLKKVDIKQVVLFHEAHLNFSPDQVINVTDLPRPLFENIDLPNVVNEHPVIGSFGFGFPDKNFPGICQLVKDQYKKATVRLNIPFAQFGDADGGLAYEQADRCLLELGGSKINLEVNHDFLQPAELLQFLNGNDINLFLYHKSHGRGISSATDYALSVKKPIGISDSEMFRHLPREICVNNTRLADLSIEPLKQVYEENSNERLVEAIKNVLWGK